MEKLEIVLLVFLIHVHVFFLISLWKKRNDYADVAWGLGFIILTWTHFLLQEKNYFPSFLITTMISLWGIRLSLHIFLRIQKSTQEDYRYLAWRKTWKNFYLRSYLQVFVLQGILLLIIAFPIFFIQKRESFGSFQDIIAVFLWIFGFLFEAIGDFQLKKFIANPQNKGKIIQTGLWKYTRHPNYFGEVVQWWAVFLLSFTHWDLMYLIISPICIHFLIVKISGIPLLEKKYENRADFQAYKAKTNAFFPWFVK